MNSHIGEQLVAPDGFHGLSKTIRYYFCGRRSNDGSALLIWFAMHKKQRRVHFVWLPQEQFEEALLQDPPAIVAASRQCTLPEWLSEYEGIAFEDIEDIRYKEKKQTYLQQVEAKFSKVRPLLAHENEILSANDPLKEMARYAPSSANRYRIQVWFFSYILHGRNIWALMRSSQKTGRWNRIDEQHASRKFGRASLADGSRSGWSIGQIDREKIVDSYLRYCGLAVSMAEIYRRAMVEVWGAKQLKPVGRISCITRTDSLFQVTVSTVTISFVNLGSNVFASQSWASHVCAGMRNRMREISRGLMRTCWRVSSSMRITSMTALGHSVLMNRCRR